MFVDRRTGAVISEFQHILQSIEMVLTTRIGTRVMRRDFGSRLPELIDSQLDRNGLTALYAAVNEAIAIWEPRVIITASRLNLDDVKSGLYNLTVFLQYNNQSVQATVSL